MRRPPPLAAWAMAIGISMPLIANAQTGGPYALTWSAIAGGGGMFSSSLNPSYTFGGTVGQSSPGLITGGSYTLIGGFWTRGSGSLAGLPDQPDEVPVAFRVYSNIPNPFSTTTSIAFDLPSDQRVTMEVYNLKGERVRVLLDQEMPAGRHSMTWAGIGDDGRAMAPGVYWIRTLTTNHRDVRKAVLVK